MASNQAPSASYRSREERLRDLERERALFNASRLTAQPSDPSNYAGRSSNFSDAGNHSNTFEPDIPGDRFNLSSTSHNIPQQGRDIQATIKDLASGKPTGGDPSSPSLNWGNSSRGYYELPSEFAQDKDTCFASSEGGLRGKVKLNKEGKHSFVDDVPPFPEASSSSVVGTTNNRTAWVEGGRDRSWERGMGAGNGGAKRERGVEKERSKEKDRAISRERHVSKQAARDSSKKRAISADPWTKLLAKEQKTRAKYYGTDKTLLVLMEDERAKYIQLENEYHKLLSEVQALQTNHLQELKNQERKHEADQRMLQKALAGKSDELAAIVKELHNLQQRYTKESNSWLNNNQKLERQVEKLQRLLADAETRNQQQEKALADKHRTNRDLQETVSDLHRTKKELVEQLISKDGDIKKQSAQLREREAEWMKEKEGRMKLEVQALQLDHFVSQRDEEIKTLKAQVSRYRTEVEPELSRTRAALAESRKEAEVLSKREKQYLGELEQAALRERKLYTVVEEHAKTKGALIEARKEVDELVKREKQYLEDLEQAAQRERKLYSDREELAQQSRKLSNEIERRTAREQVYLQDIEHLRTMENKIREEMQALTSKNTAQTEESANLTKHLRKQQNDNARLQQDLNEAKTLATELRGTIANQEKELSQIRTLADDLQHEKDELVLQRGQILAEVASKQQEISDLQGQNADLNRRLEVETQNRQEMKAQNKEKLLAVQDRVVDLQNTLNETTIQLQEFRETEALLRQALRQKDEAIQAHTQRIGELQQQVAAIQQQFSKEVSEREALVGKKKEEITAVQEKYIVAKTTMETELNQLRAQLAQKSNQIHNLMDEQARLKVDLSEVSADRFRLEARVSELTAAESSFNRQLSNLQATLTQKDQEATLLSLKNQNLMEQVKRLEEEVHAYRSASIQKDSDLARLQSNVNELSRRLKSQVDLLLERDRELVAAANNIAPSNNGTGTTTTTNNSNASSQMNASGITSTPRIPRTASFNERNSTPISSFPASVINTNQLLSNRLAGFSKSYSEGLASPKINAQQQQQQQQSPVSATPNVGTSFRNVTPIIGVPSGAIGVSNNVSSPLLNRQILGLDDIDEDHREAVQGVGARAGGGVPSFTNRAAVNATASASNNNPFNSGRVAATAYSTNNLSMLTNRIGSSYLVKPLDDVLGLSALTAGKMQKQGSNVGSNVASNVGY
ncbi:hypothetical protein HK102_010207 [Quaeritorhiza haematococci]|nr:hypothetical protein HK102_010207 [Quaeritorhiza haematococci]